MHTNLIHIYYWVSAIYLMFFVSFAHQGCLFDSFNVSLKTSIPYFHQKLLSISVIRRKKCDRMMIDYNA